MVEKTGTFLHESDDNFEQFLVKIGEFLSYFESVKLLLI